MSVGVLLFTWPSWDGWSAFPSQSATASGVSFGALLDALAQYPAITDRRVNTVLIAHSMGSFVLEGLSGNAISTPDPVVFSSVIITASASAEENHRNWLELLALSEHVYVVSNRNDSTLHRLNKWPFRLSRRLGQGQHAKLATGVSYCDFSEYLGKKHKYFVRTNEKSAPAFQLFRHVVSDAAPFVSSNCKSN